MTMPTPPADNKPEDKNVPNVPVQPEPPKVKTVEELQAEVEHWKRFSRQNEDGKKTEFAKYQAAQTELDTLKAAQMTDAEKAIADAKALGRTEAAQTYGTKLVDAELKAAAAEAGVTVPPALKTYMNMTALLDANGDPDSTKIAELVSSFKPKEPANPYAQDLGIGAQGGDPAARDFSPAAIAKRVKGFSPFTNL